MGVAFQFASPGVDIAFLFVRILLGAMLALMGLNYLLNLGHMTGYVEMKDLPASRFGIVVSDGMLAFDGLGIALGVFPALAAGAVTASLIVETPVFHNFWAISGGQRESETAGFPRNLVMLSGALVFLALSRTAWSYTIGLTLF